MAKYELYIVETNRGYATVEADSVEDAEAMFYDDFDWDLVHWVDSEVIDVVAEKVGE